MNFKDHLDIPQKGWLGIGRHLGQIVQTSLDQQGISIEQFAEHFVWPVDYVLEYMHQYTFGSFFPEVAEYLEISTEQIFSPDTPPEEIEKANEGLRQYLTSMHLESYVPFITAKLGEDLRKNIITQLQSGLKSWKKGVKEERIQLYGWTPEELQDDSNVARYLGIEPDKFHKLIYEGDFSIRFNDFDKVCNALKIYHPVPSREPTPAERLELYVRWVMVSGGRYIGHTAEGKSANDVEQYVINTQILIWADLSESTNIAKLVDCTIDGVLEKS